MSFDLREIVVEQTSYKAFGASIDHYHAILAHLSTYFNDSIIVDMGTHRGGSAAALSYNKSNKVYTFDITPTEQAAELFKEDEYKNIIYIIGNCIEDNWFGMAMLWKDRMVESKSDKEIFLSSELIFMDIDPHNGVQEDKVLNFLISNNWKGILVCDDIGLGREKGKENAHPAMRDWWNSIELPKYDISKNYFAAGTGTGVVCFDGQEVIF